MTEARLKLGIICYQPIGKSMAGPAIRCWELAGALSEEFEVTLYAPEGSSLEPDGFELAAVAERDLDQALAGCDVILCQGFTLNRHPDLKRLGKFLIVDLYVPLALEALVTYESGDVEEQLETQGKVLMATADKLAAGDFFICASERQRHFWLGWLAAAGRVTPDAFGDDPDLRRLIDVVPFGFPEEAPRATGKVLKGVYSGVAADDKVLLWGGGIYNWLDPLTPIRAAALLSQKRNDIKLFFLGARHPDPQVPAMRAYDEAVALSRELGVFGESVIFNDKWVEYEDRVNYLLESDLGASANLPHIETRFSFRTRILDCIWAGLPVVSTAGDSLSDLIEARQLGIVVASGDAQAYAGAIEKLVDDDGFRESCRENLRRVAPGFTWKNAAAAIGRRLAGYDPAVQPAPRQSLDKGSFWDLVRRKDDHVQTLWEMVIEKDGHIENLKRMVKDKDLAIEHLQKILPEKGTAE